MTREPGRLWVALTAMFGLGAAGAGPPVAGDVALEYRAVAGCPGEHVFRERAADMFRFQDPFVLPGKGATHRMRIEIEPHGKGYRGTLGVLGPDGVERTASEERADCDALVFAVAHRVPLAMLDFPAEPAAASDPPPPAAPAIDPHVLEEIQKRLDRLEEKSEAQDEKNKTLEQANRALYLRVAILENELKRRMNLSYTLSTGLLLTANLTSVPGPGVWIGGDLRINPLSFGIELRAVLPAQFDVGRFDTDLSHFVALATPCGRYWIFFGCFVAGAGMQVTHDSNFEGLAPGQSPTAFSPLVQLGGRLGVEVPLGDTFAIRGWAELLYGTPSWRENYISNNQLISADRPDVSAFFGAGVVLKFGDEGEK